MSILILFQIKVEKLCNLLLYKTRVRVAHEIFADGRAEAPTQEKNCTLCSCPNDKEPARNP